jgi:uncharacterized membrane protein HdeD (DUF308 family)
MEKFIRAYRAEKEKTQMVDKSYSTYEDSLLAGLGELQHKWGWLMTLGIVMVILGVLALGTEVQATFITVGVLGWLMMIGGAVLIVNSFWSRRWSGFFLHLLMGILYLVVGLLITANPAVGAITLTLLLAAFFLFSGLFRMCMAVAMRYPKWGWGLFSGIITFALGVLIWAQWPLSGLWVIGLFIGIDMIIYGWSLIMFAGAVREIGGPSSLREARTV